MSVAIGREFRCPKCGSSYFRTQGIPPNGTGFCKGRIVWLDADLQPTTEDRGVLHDYERCDFTWSRRDDALYFVKP